MEKKAEGGTPMENFENDQFRQEPEIQEQEEQQAQQEAYRPEPEQQTYRGVGVGRKESPFSDSPYVMNQPEPEPYRYENSYIPPVPPQDMPRKAKKHRSENSRKVWKAILCAVLAIALVAGSCGVTAHVINNKWESRTDMMIDSTINSLLSPFTPVDVVDNNFLSFLLPPPVEEHFLPLLLCSGLIPPFDNNKSSIFV